MTEPNIVRTETCKFLSYRDDKQTNVKEVELELIAKLVPYLWNEDEDKISFAVVCEETPGLLLEVDYPDGVAPGGKPAASLLMGSAGKRWQPAAYHSTDPTTWLRTFVTALPFMRAGTRLPV